ncbi:MAG: seryl-tRNA synthetase [Candidatus Tokpelaia sp. JSC085]|nr:MAG: seryl-tRNA synthetase [Candidatus Tokpelaia sp. JSC085]
MLDIKWIRKNPKMLDNALFLRNDDPKADAVLFVDQKRRAHVRRLQEMQERHNILSKEIKKAIVAGDTVHAEALKSEVSKIKIYLATASDEERRLTQVLEDILSRLPNIPLQEVPVGRNEEGNLEIRQVGVPRSFNFPPKEHYDLGIAMQCMDFERAAHISGSRFTVLLGKLAFLERAIGQFMLDVHTRDHGYQEVSPPLLVRHDSVYGTAQLPKFADDLFRTTDERWLIPTAEVPLTNLMRDEILDASMLPLRFAALTPCFRSEAGSAGRDTYGMFRQHQFWKVEMVSITDSDSSLGELERMTGCAEEILKRLELPFRTVVLCTGDMGFSACKTYDIEVWLPGQNKYREIASCSLCGDFQARRMNMRYRLKGKKALHFVHTLNGSGTAVGRCFIAVLENYQQSDGRVMIPAVLRPYMRGLEVLDPYEENV